jgi:membrane protease YdiL (CAAX protease family)
MGGARSPTTLLNLVLGGLLFGLLAARGGGIAAAAAAHASWNWGERIFAGLDPNPGVGAFGAIRNYDIVGPLLWGGSDEGLNASLAMTMALVALLAALIVLVRAQSGKALDAALEPHVERTRLA